MLERRERGTPQNGIRHSRENVGGRKRDIGVLDGLPRRTWEKKGRLWDDQGKKGSRKMEEAHGKGKKVGESLLQKSAAANGSV